MTERLQIYRCNICGNIVEMLHPGVGTLVCCDQPMELLTEKAEDVGREKHIPVVERIEGGVRVRVGPVPHPMEENHYIEWIELVAGDAVYRSFLKPGDKPEAEFKVTAEKLEAREYCSVHGLWKSP